MNLSLLAVPLVVMADLSGVTGVMNDYITPTIRALALFASLICVVFLVNGGYQYMTSSGKPERLENAKRVLRGAVIGLVIVLASVTITSLLTSAYDQSTRAESSSLPELKPIAAGENSNGLVDVVISASMGLINNIIQAVGSPFLDALSFFTTSTPLMASNPSVFNLWLGVVIIANSLFVLVVALIGFQVMSAASLGLDEIDFRHLLPRIVVVFLLVNSSIFLIDGFIELSNVLIAAIGKVSGAATVWQSLTSVMQEAGGQGLAALLLMLVFLVFTVFLLVYYVLRLITLFIGAVLSPLVVLLWLIPGFRDFSETAMKTYLTTIFTLFVHVVILLLAASLFSGMSVSSGGSAPDVLMAMVVGIATVASLLKTQSVLMQLSYVSMGSRNARKLSGQFMNGVSYMTSKRTSRVAPVRRTLARVTPGSMSGGRATKGSGMRVVMPSTGGAGQPRSPGVTVGRVPEKQPLSMPSPVEGVSVTPRTIPKTKGTEGKRKGETR